MEIVVKGRHCEVSERFRRHAADKLDKLERFDQRVLRIDVEVSKEANPRLAESAERIELTVVSKGPVVRAEAAAADRYAALDVAVERLEARMRRAAERRNSTRRHRVGVGHSSVAQTTLDGLASEALDTAEVAEDYTEAAPPIEAGAAVVIDDNGPFIVREKTHQAHPMNLDQALYRMELVGHDFYLFVDEDSGQPSVVYRRRGYDYGVIRLSL